jgi:hypothetical protein
LWKFSPVVNIDRVLCQNMCEDPSHSKQT